MSAVSLPDATAADADFPMRATANGVLIVLFGYTNCPDICPTSMATVRTAFGRLGSDAAKVGVAMVTVDPARDTDDVLARYVRGFVDSGHALRTEDGAALRAAATAFGADYSVTTGTDGTVEVSHTSMLYAVDDQGKVALVWPFGTTASDITSDLRLLLRRAGS